MVNTPPIYDIAILGGGVIGLSILRSTTLSSFKTILLESSPHLLSSASGSNSGIICTGTDAPLESLERSLIRDSISRIRPYCNAFRIPMRECGSLVCSWSEEEEEGLLNEVLRENRDAGDGDVTMLTPNEVLEMEPGLEMEDLKGAVYIPGEIVIDPWLLPITYAIHARENGAVIWTEYETDFECVTFDSDTRLWTLPRRRNHDDDVDVDDENKSTVTAKMVINAAGIQADILQSQIRHAPPPNFESRPRRGQYKLFSPLPPHSKLIRPIQPVPTPRTKGIFVYSTLYDQIVVGPTASEQSSRIDVTPDDAVARLLEQTAKRVLKRYDAIEPCGEYVGIRPATNHRDYRIGLVPDTCWITVAGIRSTGLTASLGIGQYVLRLVTSVLDRPAEKRDMSCSKLPEVKDLAKRFREDEDGMVEIGGYRYKVTHPITRIGWKEGTSLASSSSLSG